MLKHYWTTAIRQIKQSKLFSAINIIGFTISIAAAFFIYLWVVDEFSYDRFHKDSKEIYRVLSLSPNKKGEMQYSEFNVFGLAPVLRTEFPKIADATQFYQYGNEFMTVEYQDKKLQLKDFQVDNNFFSFFSFPVVEGDPTQLEKDPSAIVLSEKSAKKLFGEEPATGKKISETRYRKTTIYTVVGVVKVPHKSHMQFDAARSIDGLLSFYNGKNPNMSGGDRTWKSRDARVYLKKKKGIEFTADDYKEMSTLMGKKGGDEKILLDFQLIEDIRLRSDLLTKGNYTGNTEQGDLKLIFMFITLALVVIFMGAFNFSTLSTARSSLRYKEIGVRKVCGAYRKKLIQQFISESVVLSMISLILAFGLAELFLPAFNYITGKEIDLTFDWTILLFVLICVFGVGVLAGCYPAFYLSAINPLIALKGGTKTGKKGVMTKILVTVQFTFAIILMLCTAGVLKQLYLLENKDLGLDKSNVVTVNCGLWYGVGNFKQEVLKNPDVISVSIGSNIDNYGPGWNGTNIKWEADGKADSLQMVSIWADNDMVSTYGLKIVAGSIPKSDLDAYFNGTMKGTILINETAWKAMKVDNPVGIMTNWGEITGVVKDFHFRSLREKLSPAFLVYNPECVTVLHIRINPEKKNKTLRFLQEKYESMNKGKSFEYAFFEDILTKNYAPEQQQSSIFTAFTLVAVCIAMMGVLGLVILTTYRRTKEIGIRKVTGAKTPTIIRMLCMEYIKWIALAYVIACPIGWYLINRWLETFAYRTEISWWLFVGIGVLVLLITVLTVGIQSYRTASQDPVKSLRDE